MKMSKKHTAIGFAGAIVLLAASGIGSTRAALTYYSENYTAQMELKSIGVALVENGTTLVERNGYKEKAKQEEKSLFQNLLKDEEEFKIGHAYPEKLTVKNTGNMNEYVRVTVTRYWTDTEGKKLPNLSPAYIQIGYNDRDWMKDEKQTTQEREIWYYKNLLEPGEESQVLADSITIDDAIVSKVTETRTTKDGVTTIEADYVYDQAVFHVKAEVDGVQTHNASDAMKSAWGVDMKIEEDGTIGFQQEGKE